MRVERRLGDCIRAQKDTVGLNKGAMGIGTSAVLQENRTPALADARIDKKPSSRAQNLAPPPFSAINSTRWRRSPSNWRAADSYPRARVLPTREPIARVTWPGQSPGSF